MKMVFKNKFGRLLRGSDKLGHCSLKMYSALSCEN